MIKVLGALALATAVPLAAAEPPVAPTAATGDAMTPAPVAPVAPAPPSAPTPPSTPALTPAQLAAAQYRTKIVCRSSVETGSLIAKRKTCLTGKQWEYVDQAHRDEARKMMMDNMGKPPGG